MTSPWINASENAQEAGETVQLSRSLHTNWAFAAIQSALIVASVFEFTFNAFSLILAALGTFFSIGLFGRSVWVSADELPSSWTPHPATRVAARVASHPMFIVFYCFLIVGYFVVGVAVVLFGLMIGSLFSILRSQWRIWRLERRDHVRLLSGPARSVWGEPGLWRENRRISQRTQYRQHVD